MKITHLIAIGFIFAATSIAWVVLGAAMKHRTEEQTEKLGDRIADGWGPQLTQMHPVAWHAAPGAANGRRPLAMSTSDISVDLAFEPRKRGLTNHRTYLVDFKATYEVMNTTPVSQTVYVSFELPDRHTSYKNFSFVLGDGGESKRSPRDGTLCEAVVLPSGKSTSLTVTYRARGVDEWRYAFNDNSRVSNYRMVMKTDFREYDFPDGTGSPSNDRDLGKGWEFTFFSVLVLQGIERGKNLHPMNYFFLSAAFFAFHILLAYLVDVLPLYVSFGIAGLVSMVLVGGYIRVVSGGSFTIQALIAQGVYLILFSYTFFFPGMTGLAITIGSVATLAILMFRSARIDWSTKFKKPAQVPPPILSVS
jgi:Inner membrane protein CreD